MIDLQLNGVEIDHILELLKERKEEGSYYGQKKHYYGRTDRLISYFEQLLKVTK